MTKTTKTQKAKKTTKKATEAKTSFVANLKTPAIVRKGFRAYVGMFGAAYEAARPVFDQTIDKAVKNYDDFAANGEKLETVAATYANDTRKNVVDFAKAAKKTAKASVKTTQTIATNVTKKSEKAA